MSGRKSNVFDLTKLPDRAWFKKHPGRTTYIRRVLPADNAPPGLGSRMNVVRKISGMERRRKSVPNEMMKLASAVWGTEASNLGESFCCFVWDLLLENEANGGFVDHLTVCKLADKHSSGKGVTS